MCLCWWGLGYFFYIALLYVAPVYLGSGKKIRGIEIRICNCCLLEPDVSLWFGLILCRCCGGYQLYLATLQHQGPLHSSNALSPSGPLPRLHTSSTPLIWISQRLASQWREKCWSSSWSYRNCCCPLLQGLRKPGKGWRYLCIFSKPSYTTISKDWLV